MSNKIKILSLDGGTHGFTWLYCLREIERDNPGFLSQADVLVGSSFGGFCALYLSRHLGSIAKGESALDIINGCVTYMSDILAFEPDQAACARLIGGEESMYSHERMNEVLIRSENLADATMGDLARRTVIITYGTCNPSWAPTVYDSADEANWNKRASEAALEAAAFPVMLPIRGRLTNGSLGGPNGSMEAIARVVGNDSSKLDDVVLFSLGCDSDNCKFGHFPTPWDEAEAVPPMPSWDGQFASLDKDAAAVLKQYAEQLWQKFKTSMAQYDDAAYMLSKYGFSLSGTGYGDGNAGSTSWGWKPWLLDMTSPLYFYQAIIANQALQVSGQASQFLGERAFRLAPLAFLSSGSILFMTFLPTSEYTHEVIQGVGLVTAALWSHPMTSTWGEFTPNVEQTEAYIDRYWMPTTDGTPRERPAPDKRLSGWRLGRDLFQIP